MLRVGAARNRGHNEEKIAASRQARVISNKMSMASARPQRRRGSTTASPIQNALFGKEDQFIPLSLPHRAPPPSAAPGVGTLSLCVPAPYPASDHSDRSSDCSRTLGISSS